MAKKYLAGFDLRNGLDSAGVKSYPVGTTVNIAKGDMITLAAGYATLATSMVALTVGVAQHDANNSAGADGAIDVMVIPILSKYSFRVPVEANALITVAAVGTIVDLSTEDGIAINDTSVTANGFLIDAIDVSTEAVAANAYGYAIGHFVAIT